MRTRQGALTRGGPPSPGNPAIVASRRSAIDPSDRLLDAHSHRVGGRRRGVVSNDQGAIKRLHTDGDHTGDPFRLRRYLRRALLSDKTPPLDRDLLSRGRYGAHRGGGRDRRPGHSGRTARGGEDESENKHPHPLIVRVWFRAGRDAAGDRRELLPERSSPPSASRIGFMRVTSGDHVKADPSRGDG